jgi:Cysteine-rich secretory protein family
MRSFRLAAMAAVLPLVMAGCGGGGGASPAGGPLAVEGIAAVRSAPAPHGHFVRLNEVRGAMALPALAWSDSLAAAAQAHADYQRLNSVQGHGEQSSLPGFTGIGWGDRAARAGYTGQLVGETIIGGQPQVEADGRDLMDVLLAAPGHRMVLLAHEFSEAGVGGVPLTTNLGLRGTMWSAPGRVTLYPYSGQTGVLTSFAPASESPNPLPGVALTGMPLSLHTGMFSSFVANSASLVETATGHPVALRANGDVGQTRSAFVFYPQAALAANTAYTFRASVTIAGATREVTSAFTTGVR